MSYIFFSSFLFSFFFIFMTIKICNNLSTLSNMSFSLNIFLSFCIIVIKKLNNSSIEGISSYFFSCFVVLVLIYNDHIFKSISIIFLVKLSFIVGEIFSWKIRQVKDLLISLKFFSIILLKLEINSSSVNGISSLILLRLSSSEELSLSNSIISTYSDCFFISGFIVLLSFWSFFSML